jgi:hypothetical protein
MVRIASLLLAAAPLLWAADSRNTSLPDTNTHFTMPEYKTLAEWEARKKVLRQQILIAAGLHPMPDFGPVRSQIFGRIENKDYSIEKVLLETRPGYHLGGNLYRPLGRQGKFPAVASPHGHWTYGRLEHTPSASIPARCINLARQGYVVFAYDMVGYNDTIQTPHSFGNRQEQLWSFGPFGLQLWNSIRVVDFLSGLPDVDPSRIGATGASGGGTQTFFLAAVDDRVKFAAPVNMISAIMQGGSPCENAPGLRVGAFNVEYGAMMAPRPLLMISATGDWTRNTPKEEYPAIKRIYDLYDRAAYVESVQIDAPHNYNQQSREAVYRFFAKHALGDSDGAKYGERGIRLEKLGDMLALHNRALPAGALDYPGVFTQWRAYVLRQLQGITNPEEKRRLLQLALGTEWPREVTAQGAAGNMILSRPGAGDEVHTSWKDGKAKIVTVLFGGGSAPAPSLSIEVFQTRDHAKSHFFTFNRTDDALRVQDILTALRWLDQKGYKEIQLDAAGDAAIWCRFAAAVSPIKVKLNAEVPGFQGTGDELALRFFVPGLQRAGGWKFAMDLTQGN